MSDDQWTRSVWLEQYGVDAWERMSTIREIESRLAEYTKRGYIRGSSHPAIGMEAVAVGVSLNLRQTDAIASTHRGHAHCLAKGADPQRLLAELFGRATGYCHGKGGSMHLGVRELGILGTNGIVGASIGIATGAALAARQQHTDEVVIAYFGDGAMGQGMFHEALNLAAIWRLPCIYVCENNHYAQSARVEEMISVSDLASRAQAYSMPGVNVDGMDVYAVWSAAREAILRARQAEGPTLLVADTYRFLGHMVGDTEIYRTAEEREEWRKRDPIARLEADLRTAGLVDTATLDAKRAQIVSRIDEAEVAAVAAPAPSLKTAYTDVYGGKSDA